LGGNRQRGGKAKRQRGRGAEFAEEEKTGCRKDGKMREERSTGFSRVVNK